MQKAILAMVKILTVSAQEFNSESAGGTLEIALFSLLTVNQIPSYGEPQISSMNHFSNTKK
jgi:hypothetical protein